MSDDYPVVNLGPLSLVWASAYEAGNILDRLFPDQDGYDFAQALAYNVWGDDIKALPFTANITGLLCAHAGENDGDDWTWLVRLNNGEHWWFSGGCDYTGWDCQSHLTWEKAE